MIDIKRARLLDRLVKKGVVLPSERQQIAAQRFSTDKVNSLLMTLRQNTATEFESFLTVLSDSGQQAIADAVQQALRVFGEEKLNPLQYIYRKIYLSYVWWRKW